MSSRAYRWDKNGKNALRYKNWDHFQHNVAREFCPYGQPGDRLWVRETFTLTNHGDPVYKADFRDNRGHYWASVAADPDDVRWRPSIHIPRSASRITLEISYHRLRRWYE